MGGEPARNHRRDIRIGARFAGAEEEASGQQHVVVRCQPGHRGEGRPPEHDAGQNVPRAVFVAPHAGRNFKGRVGDGERTDDPSPLLGAETQIVLHPLAGDADADAVEVGDDRQQEQQSQDSVTIRHKPFILSQVIGCLHAFVCSARPPRSALLSPPTGRASAGRMARGSLTVIRRPILVPPGTWLGKPRRPPGKSSPVIVNGKLILTGHDGDRFLTVA